MFGMVLFVVVVLGAIFACVTLITVRRVYGQIGRGRLSINDDLSRSEPVQHDDEIRQMLQARNEHRQRRGEAPLDVETELARLTLPTTVDPQLAEEVRQLVIARNERRARQGEQPLDVENEVARQLRDVLGRGGTLGATRAHAGCWSP
jgi:hypothetical protein